MFGRCEIPDSRKYRGRKRWGGLRSCTTHQQPADGSVTFNLPRVDGVIGVSVYFLPFSTPFPLCRLFPPSVNRFLFDIPFIKKKRKRKKTSVRNIRNGRASLESLFLFSLLFFFLRNPWNIAVAERDALRDKSKHLLPVTRWLSRGWCRCLAVECLDP